MVYFSNAFQFSLLQNSRIAAVPGLHSLFFFSVIVFGWWVSHPYEQLLYSFPKGFHCSESFHFPNLNMCPRSQTSDTPLDRFCTSDKCDKGPPPCCHTRHLLPPDSFEGPAEIASFSSTMTVHLGSMGALGIALNLLWYRWNCKPAILTDETVLPCSPKCSHETTKYPCLLSQITTNETVLCSN